jgi:hypothetical protein
MGIVHVPPKSTLSYANMHRNWEIFADAYFAVLNDLREQLKFHGIKTKSLNLNNKIKIIDSSLLQVALEVIDWAAYRQKKGALKLHMLLDGHDLLPDDAWITDGKAHDLEFARELKFDKGTIILIDRGYNDYALYQKWNESGCFFVTRMKKNAKYEVIRKQDIPEYEFERIISDEIIKLKGTDFECRRIVFYDPDKKEYVCIITNNLELPAETIGLLYRQRWQIEIFFRDLKQNFHIKSFVGTSPNAVLIQIWTALLSILIIKFMQLMSRFNWGMSNLLALFRVNLLNRIDLWEWVHDPFKRPPDEPDIKQPFLPGLMF